jgi:hypothetical protein
MDRGEKEERMSKGREQHGREHSVDRAVNMTLMVRIRQGREAGMMVEPHNRAVLKERDVGREGKFQG